MAIDHRTASLRAAGSGERIMRTILPLLFVCVVFEAIASADQSGADRSRVSRSLVERDAAIGVHQPGPHEGGGDTTAYPFFAKATDLGMVFRKRVLHQGSAIGYHLQEFDEVFYIVSGTGDYMLNGKSQTVSGGTAILTRAGDSHGLRPTGNQDLVMIIAYPKPDK
jgi:mannose-6-phosphate isomerase-like protein (cupin superfamily)